MVDGTSVAIVVHPPWVDLKLLKLTVDGVMLLVSASNSLFN
jgi:hypothetical protein